MLLNQPQPLPQSKADKIRQFLNSETGHDLMKYLMDRGADLTAQAGNKLIESTGEKGDEVEKEEAMALALKGRLHLEMVNKLLEMSDPEYVFQVVHITPLPLNVSQQTT
jgi:hypothetical protein